MIDLTVIKIELQRYATFSPYSSFDDQEGPKIQIGIDSKSTENSKEWKRNDKKKIRLETY